MVITVTIFIAKAEVPQHVPPHASCCMSACTELAWLSVATETASPMLTLHARAILTHDMHGTSGVSLASRIFTLRQLSTSPSLSVCRADRGVRLTETRRRPGSHASIKDQCGADRW